MSDFSCVSRLSGGMGLDVGLEKAGFTVPLTADNMGAAFKTIKANRPRLRAFSDEKLSPVWVASDAAERYVAGRVEG
jgi:site-specific DNA-cytosine methylase